MRFSLVTPSWARRLVAGILLRYRAPRKSCSAALFAFRRRFAAVWDLVRDELADQLAQDPVALELRLVEPLVGGRLVREIRVQEPEALQLGEGLAFLGD